MASLAVSHSSSDSFQPFEFNKSVQSLVDSSNLKALPSKFTLDSNETTASSCDSLPVVDFSALVSLDPHQRSKSITELAEACADWGFFILVNHGIPEAFIAELFATVREFFALPDDEKKQYEAKSTSSPIACGNFNVKSTSNQSFTLWRDFLKLYVHPDFHCPTKPHLLREILQEYTAKTRKMARELVIAVSEAMELDQNYVEEALKLNSSFQKFGGNFYPPCPQPDQTIGLPPHNDPGLFTILLIHNGLAGLQIERHGQWFEVNPPANSMIVNVGDQLEIFSNGRCKSSRHRAVVNKQREILSIAVGNGPGKDVVVGPAAPLVEKDGGALYRSMKYQDYVESQLTRTFNGKSILEEQMFFHDDEK